MRLVVVLSCFLLIHCSSGSFSYRSPGPYSGGPLLGTGSYLMEITFEPRGSEALRFNATFSRKSYGSVFEAVTPGGKVLLQVREPMVAREEPLLREPPSELPLSPALLELFYRALRPLILLADDPAVPSAVVTERFPDGRPRALGPNLRITEYDWDGHAFRVELTGSDWTARLVMREYDVSR